MVLDPSALIDFCKDSMFASQICGILTFVLKVGDDCLAIYIIITFKYFNLICLQKKRILLLHLFQLNMLMKKEDHVRLSMEVVKKYIYITIKYQRRKEKLPINKYYIYILVTMLSSRCLFNGAMRT